MSDRELFIAVLQLEFNEKRSVYLQEVCGSDLAQQQRVEKLLQRHEASESFLNPDRLERTEALGIHAAQTCLPVSQEAVGDEIGPFKLLQKLGDGGMGTVWVAEQEKPVKRRVALKLVKAGMDTSEVLGRFEAERQALALMDHTNIAKVFDAGTSARGRPYFVMELIKGVPITTYCDEVHASLRDRLDLFIQVCAAVQHAHQKGIIHRDIKPSNVLVSMQDGRPVPKVIDFGVAKARHTKLSDQTMYTEIGKVVGTLEYMAPEQAELSAMDIDTRADIYALGILLYELLTGSTPITKQRMKSAAFVEILRIIREEEPPKPSTRLSESLESMASVASLRRTDARRLSDELRGELDWVVLKALEKDRTRRYETPNSLSRDLQRYLLNEPVEARPPSASYRLRKFVRRNRGAVIAASLIVLTLLVGFIVSSYGFYLADLQRQQREAAEKHALEQWQRAEEQAAEAKRQEKLARTQEALTLADFRASTDEAIEQLIGSKPELGTLEKAYLEKTLKRWQDYADRKGDDEHSRAIRAEGHFNVALLWAKLGHKEEARAEFIFSRDLREKLVEQFPAVPQHQLDLATVHNNLAIILRDLGKGKQALEEYQLACNMHSKLHQQFPAVPVYRRQLGLDHNNLGLLLFNTGKAAEASTEYQAALALQLKLVEEFPAASACQLELATTHDNLGLALVELGKFDEAKNQYQHALDIQNKLIGQFPSEPKYQQELARAHNNFGLLCKKLGLREQARKEQQAAHDIRKQLVQKFPVISAYRRDLAASHNNLGLLCIESGLYEQARSEYRAAHTLRKKLAEEFPSDVSYLIDLGGSYCNSGHLARTTGDPTESLKWYELAVQTLTTAYQEDPGNANARQFLRNSHSGRARSYEQLQQLDKAAEELNQVIRLSSAVDQPGLRARRAHMQLRAGLTAEAVAEVAELALLPSWSKSQWYNFARVYSMGSSKVPDKKKEYANRAMELLSQAVNAGFQDAAQMTQDPYLDPLREREDYKKLVETMKQKQPTSK